MRRTSLPHLRGLLLAAALLGGCGSTELVLSADRTMINAGGNDFATITATVMDQGEPGGAGTKISFSTSAGSFSTREGETDIDSSTDRAGRAQVKLYSAKSQGQATVTAYFYDEGGTYRETSITIQFIAPLPVDGTLRLGCDAVNIGALRQPVPKIVVTCSLDAQARDGSTIPASALAVQFLSEAGTVTAEDDYYSGERIFLYSPKGGSSSPRDVAPDTAVGEPSYADSNGKVRNPRDGLVTLVAVVQGEEAFTDTNGDGDYDQGEPFVDTAEPFLDEDDDDERDAEEKYVDVNGNNRWDKANGVWDSKIRIMAIYKLLWTGELYAYAKAARVAISGTSTAIADGGQLELTAYPLDINGNPVAAFQKNGDYLEWTLSTSGYADTSGDTTPPMRNALGFSFDTSASTERKRWKISPNSFAPPTYGLTIKDSYPKDGIKVPDSYSVTVKAYLTPGPAGEDYYLDQLAEALDDKVSGTCD